MNNFYYFVRKYSSNIKSFSDFFSLIIRNKTQNKMTQTKKQKLIAETMEEEKRKLFCYACYRLGDANEAKDILQDIFITLCATPGVIENTKNLKNYIYRCLSNKCNTQLRSRQKLQLVDIESNF